MGWLAPKEVQERVGCIIGKDYPKPMVDHSEISKINIGKMKESYAKKINQKSKTPPSSKSVKKEAASLSTSKKRKTVSKNSSKKQPKIDATLKKMTIKTEN